MRIESRTRHAYTLILCAACLLTYAPSLRGDFVMDDRPVFQNNPYLRSAEYIPRFFSSGVWSNTGMEDAEGGFLYRPMFLLLAWVNYQVWGGSAFGFHLTSVFLHILNALLVLALLRRLTDRTGPSTACMFGALLFALHPVQSESVGWLAGVTDPLVTLFLLASLLLYIRFSESGKPRDLLISLLAFCGALLSKEVAVVFPFLVLGYDLLFNSKRRSNWFLLYFLVLTLFMLLRYSALGAVGGGLSLSAEGWAVFVRFLLGYLRLLVAPWPIRFYYDPPTDSVAGFESLIIVLGVLAGAAWYVRRSGGGARLVTYGCAWTVLLLLPALALSFHDPPRFAVRVLYLPSIGAVLASMPLLKYALVSHRKVATFVVSVLCMVFAAATVTANRAYENEEAFFTRALETSPNNVGTYFGLAHHYRRTGRPHEAIETFQQGLEVVGEGDLASRTSLLSNIGAIYGELGELDRAQEFFEMTIEINPSYSEALVGLGNLAWHRGDLPTAAEYYEKAVVADPGNEVANYNLSLIRQKLGEGDR